VRDLGVTGTATWHQGTGAISASVTITGSGRLLGRLRFRWNDWERHAVCIARGRLGGRGIRLAFPAP
jgi:hypothetical protein